MRLWPKTKKHGWYGPWDLMRNLKDAPENIGDAAYEHVWGVQPTVDWVRGKGKDIEQSKIGSAILSTSPSAGMSYGDEGFQAQAGLNQAQGGPSITVGQGQAGQAEQADQGIDWGGNIMSLLPILAQGASSYMQYGREEKDRERMAAAQKQADWLNFVVGRNVASPEYTPSKVSGWEKLANIGGQALQMGQQQRVQAEQGRLRDLQAKQLEGSLAGQAIERKTLEETARENRIRQQAAAKAARVELGAADVLTFGEETEPTTTMGGRQPGPPLSRGHTQREIDIYDIERAGQLKEKKLYDLQVSAQEVGLELAGLKIENQKRLAELPDTKAVLGVAAAFGALNPGLSKEEFFSSPMVINTGSGKELTPAQKTAMYATYKVAERDNALALDAAARGRRDNFQKNMKSEEIVKIRASIMRAWTMMQNGVQVGSGVGDVQLMKMLALLQDPGSVVREQEYNTLAEAVGAFEKALVIAPGLLRGDKLTDEGRARILRLGMLAYQDRMGEIDQLADAYTESELGMSMADASPEQLQLYKLASNPFRMPAIDEEKTMAIFGLLGKGSPALIRSLDRGVQDPTVAGLVPVARSKDEQELYDELMERSSAAAKSEARESWGPWAGMVPGVMPYRGPDYGVKPSFRAVGRVYPGRPY